MPIHCVVGGCSRNQKNAPGASFYTFPSDTACERQWIRFVNNTRSDFQKRGYSRVCSAHFLQADFQLSSLLKRKFGIAGARLLLKPSSVPSVRKPHEENASTSSPTKRLKILDDALGLDQVNPGGESRKTDTDALPVSIIRVCEEDLCNHFEDGEPTPSNSHSESVEKTILDQRNTQTQWLEEEIRLSPPQPVAGKPDHGLPTKITKLKGVSFSHESGNQHRQAEALTARGATANVAKETASNGRGAVCPTPAPKPQKEQNGQPRKFLFYLVPATNVVCVPHPPSRHSDVAEQRRLKIIEVNKTDQLMPRIKEEPLESGRKVESGESRETESDLGRSQWDLMRQEADWDSKQASGNDDPPIKIEFVGDEGQAQIVDMMDTIEEPAEDSGGAVTSGSDQDEQDLEEDSMEFEDHSSDQDYVPEARVRVSKRKAKRRGRALRPKRVCQKPPVGDKEANSPTDDGMEEDSAESSGDGEDQDDAGSSPDEEEEDLLSSSEDSDEIGQRAKKKHQKKKYRTSYIRLEVQFSRLPKLYECKTCRERFENGEDVKTHHTEAHSKEPDRIADDRQQLSDAEAPLPFVDDGMADIATELRQCKKCKEYVEDMPKHHRLHVNKNLVCETCGKCLTSRFAFNHHKLRHQVDRMGHLFQCPECDKSYASKQSLNIHCKAVHRGKQVFVCESCGKQFNRYRTLRVHKLIHLKEKPYKCPECGRGFTQQSNMAHHMRVHTGARPYKCDICSEAFNHNISLKTHQKKIHGIDWWKDKK